MILPKKHLPISKTLLAAGSELLTAIESRDMPIEEAVDAVKSALSKKGIRDISHDYVLLAFDMLFLIGLINISDAGQVYRETN